MNKPDFSLFNKCLIFNSKNYPLLLCFFFLLFITSSTLKAQTVTSYTSNGTFTVPPEITAIKVEAWGGGGAGGGAATLVALVAEVGGGGGGGGAYNSTVFSVTPAQQYTITVGLGGTTNGSNGGASTVSGFAGSISANGGNGGGNGSSFLNVLTLIVVQGAGGSGGTGQYNGGAGITAVNNNSGSGGGGAGNQAAGTAGGSVTSGGAGGAGSYPGGNGADSFTTTNNGINGAVPGGGGGGARITGLLSITSRVGGYGGNGLVRITAYRCYPGYSTTWNGTTWTTGAPTKEKAAVIDANYTTATNGNITACSCQINANKVLTISTSNQTEIYNEIINNGTVEVTNNASLVQWYSTNSNSGQVKVYRNAHPMKRYDFTYWASPVTGQNMNTFSPNTLWDKYYSYDPSSGWVTHFNGAATMGVGNGYAIRAPQSFPITTTNTFTGIFNGALNNGEITVSGFKGSASSEVWNLIGNPYPSAIDIDLFFADPDNSEAGGTVYLWTHNTPPISNAAQYLYSASDYASYNLSGGVAIAATDDPNDPTEADDNDNAPVNGYIASGQAFFIRGVKQFDDLTPAVSPIVKFKNSMRVPGNNTNFFKPGTTTPVENWEMTGKHRFWINLRNNEGAFNQTLIGYIQNATDGLDRLYDGELFGGNYVTLYSLLDQNKLTIQGKSLPFHNDDVVPLGYITTIAGNFTISLDHFDGLFEGQDVFLRDKLLNAVHNLKQNAYAFASAIGTFDDRFEIAYTNETLGTQNPEINPDGIIIYKNTASDIVVNAGLSLLDEVSVYDVAGRLLYQQRKINKGEAFIQNVPTTQQVLIVDVVTTEGFKATKKIIF